MNRINIAVYGLGYMGDLYAQKLKACGVEPSQVFVVDVDKEREAAFCAKYGVQPLQDDTPIDGAIVAASTPAHHKILKALHARGVMKALVEKPAAITLEAAAEIPTDMDVSVAYLMHFSDALAHLIQEVMLKSALKVGKINVEWSKNRVPNKRPTPGNFKDEWPHGNGMAQCLVEATDEIVATHVYASCLNLPFVDEAAQRKAIAANPEMPASPTSSSNTMITHDLKSGRRVVVTQSSDFLSAFDLRRVSGTLIDAAGVPVKSFSLVLDTKGEGGKIVDILTLVMLASNERQELSFGGDKLLTQTDAFVRFLGGEPRDPRFPTLKSTMHGMRTEEAGEQSSATDKICTVVVQLPSVQAAAE